MLIPVLGVIVVLGWTLAITRNVIKGEAQPLAGWSDFGDLLTLGFKAFVISLIYAIPLIILSIPFGIIASMGEDAETWVSIASMCFSCISILYGLVLAFVFPAAMGELAATGNLGPALNPSRILELIRAANIGMVEVRSMGGAARSDLWLQIKADICGLPMVRMLEEETSVLGCAVLCAVAVGNYGSIEEAVAAMVRTGKTFLPDSKHRELYDRRFELYRRLYETLKPVFRQYT